MLIGCEAAHLGRNAQTGLALSRWGGALVGPLERWDPTGAAKWVEPSEWRKLSFRSKWWALQAQEAGKLASMGKAKRAVMTGWDPAQHAGVGREEIDRRMKAAAKDLFMPMRQAAKLEALRAMPPLVPGLADLAVQVGGGDHVCDAAGVCRWRWMQT